MPRLSPTSLFTGLLAAGLMLPVAASAQDDLKPEVMLMIDGSRLMGKTLNLNDPSCDPAGSMTVSAWQGQTPHTPMNMVKEALLGTIEAPGGVQWCTAEAAPERNQHDAGPDDDHEHARQMCCRDMNGAECSVWAPCYNDNGLRFDQEDAVQFDEENARSRDGLIDANIDQIKFGVMFTDGNIDPRTGREGHYSYGDENKTINGQPINAGARKFEGPGNLHVGALVAPHKWFYDDGGNLTSEDVGDDDERVRRHNRFVQQMVGRLVPHGEAPLSAFVRDAAQYYGGAGAECRERSMIFITRGFDAVLVNGQAPGFPYQPATTHAARLRDLGVIVHVVLVAPEGENQTQVWAQQVASAGGGQYARASTAADLRRVITKVARSSAVGRQTRTRPLVVSATTADYCDNGFPCAIEDDDTLQWRINAFSELSNGTGYGRIRATELSCDDDLEDPRRPGVPQARAATLDYDKVLRERGDRPRRAVAVRIDREEPVVLTGGDQPVFGDDGAVLFAERDALASFMGVPRREIDDDANGDFREANAADDDDPEDRDNDGAAVEDVPASPKRVRGAGLMLNGFFGARGLGAGARRQLGAVLTSDLVALRAPALGLNDPSYLAYRNAQQRRKTLVAAGARDGLIHFFRAQDGVEVLAYMPGGAWGEIIEQEVAVDGPLSFADIVPCRALNGGGNAECPDTLRFEAWLFGGAGREAANIFGVRMAAAQALAADENRPLNLEEDIGVGGAWDKSAEDLGNPGLPELTLGAAVSRPAVTHVRDGNRVRAALIMGCGKGEDGGSTGPGRCVLVVEAVTGRVIRRFDLLEDGEQFGAAGEVSSFTGSPVVYPAGGITPASRAYIGDAVGRVWRIDMRDVDPNGWSMDVAWPPIGNADEAGDYVLGRAIVDRPSVALRPDGALVVTFATDRAGEIDADRTSFAVSFTDRTVIDEDAGVTYQVTRNWLLPFSDGEYATGSPVVRDETAYITTRQSGAGAAGCAATRGRLYGLHYYKKYVDAEGAEATFRGADGKVTDARPALAQFDDDGPAGERALSVILPPGRVAYGLAIARTPSCSAEAAATTSIVLNLADEQPGAVAAAAGAVEQAKVEVVQGGNVVERPLDGAIFMRGDDVALEICIDCDAEGRPAQGAADNAPPPFPTQVVYWGSTFLN